jgi:serine/threonine protein kinase
MKTSGPEQPSTSAPQHPVRPPVPPVIPDHELLRKIGGGSYGEVWLARSTLGSFRAVKIVHRTTFEHVRPFEREFAGIKKFEPISRSHEGLVDLLQVGRNDPEGYFYYVMELADDAAENSSLYTPRTLKSELRRRGRLPLEECVRLGISLTNALAYLQGQGLVHRDIKPSNIIFVGGVPKLADVGLVAVAGEGRSYVGTEGFIPPEGPGTPQADLYSLGIVLYEISTGKSHQDFPEPLADLAAQPDHYRWLEFNAVIHKACRAEVRERYQSAEEMQQELALLQKGQSVRRNQAFKGRLALGRKLAVVGGAVIFLFCCASLLNSSLRQRLSFGSRGPERQLTTNRDALEWYSKGRYFYNKNTDTDTTNAIYCFEQAIFLDTNFAEAYVGLASSYTWLEAPRNWNKIREPTEKALALNPNLAEAHKCHAFVKYMFDWDWAGAEEEFKLAMHLDSRDGEVLRGYGYYLKNMGRMKEAIVMLTHAHEMDPRAISTTEMLGDVFYVVGDYTNALKQFQSCLVLESNRPGTLSYIAHVYEAQGQFLEAIKLFQQDDIVSGEDPKQVADRYDARRRAYEVGGATAYWQSILGFDKTDPTISNAELAVDFANLGDKKSVFDYLERARLKHEVELVQALKTNRAFDKFRKDREFIALLKNMNWD